MPSGTRRREGPRMQQQTEAWQRWRAAGIGASLAPGVMGVNPWFPRTPYEVFLLLTKRVEAPRLNDAMRRGLELEAAARGAFEAQTGLVGEPCTREHPQYPFLRARSEERRVGKECRSRWSP